MGLEPTTFGTTIRRANQLHHTHHNEPGGIRTLDLRLRRPLLYPAELQTHIALPKPLVSSLSKALRKRVMGIEPTYLAWKASVLPLNYTRTLIGVTGFEPATSWSQTRRSSQAEPHPATSKPYVLPVTQDLLYSILSTLSTKILSNFCRNFIGTSEPQKNAERIRDFGYMKNKVTDSSRKNHQTAYHQML